VLYSAGDLSVLCLVWFGFGVSCGCVCGVVVYLGCVFCCGFNDSVVSLGLTRLRWCLCGVRCGLLGCGGPCVW